MVKYKKIVFANSNKEKCAAVNLSVASHHFENEKSILQFIQDIDSWSFQKNRSEQDLIMILYNYLQRQITTLDVEIYREEVGIMVLVYSDIPNANIIEDWEEWIRFSNYSLPFDFTMFIMPYGRMKAVKSGKAPFPTATKYKLDESLTDKYSKLRVFF